MTSPSPTSFRMLRALRRQCVREVSTLLLFTSLLLQSATAVAPGWWDTQQVLTSGAVADDYTVANIGQLKNVAKKAAAEMNSALTGGAGNDINALIAEWEASPAEGVTRDDYAALTIGQLKSVVRLYYDRLAEAGVTPAGIYPWSGKNADDYALANLGQLKTVFSFEMDTGDANQNGIPDVWELQMFGNLNQIAGGDFDQDGLTNLAEYQAGTDPAKIDTDGDGVSDGDEVAQGTDPAKPPPSWKWTQAQLAEAEAAYEIGLQQHRREVNTVVQPSGGGPNPEDAVTYAYQTYLDDDLEHEIWTGSCTTNELGTATELANGAKAAHPKVDLAPLKEWEPISPSGGTGVAELTSSGGVEAYATIERGVGTAKAEFRLVRRLKAGATAPKDSQENLIKPEIKRTYLKVTTIVTDTGTTTTTAEALEFTILEGDDISKNTSGVLFPELTTAGTRRIELLPVEFKEHDSESGFDNFNRHVLNPDQSKRPWLMVPGDGDRPAKTDLCGAGSTIFKLEVKNGTQTMTPQQTGASDPLVVTINGIGQGNKWPFKHFRVMRSDEKRTK
ncbi:MAG: thrombospondin type 3 repeat-containing protein [Prosthecobacter sp.]|uniref:thrombospondin type 3 repeat-containing protein n=1 Tax=Prosthecobacter sp. TaxID=1965333 RepID=UPI0025E4D87B|nr:thrombospondin type 3 repeat-containing protein [Prosthecobacter sp.]MCF7785888.1 thrombospondin type 3 repeat-containing protein [Prosthecobacter sp.]